MDAGEVRAAGTAAVGEAARGSASPVGAAPALSPESSEAVEGAAEIERGECPECDEALVGDYCHRCGEKRPDSRDLTVRHFFSEAAQELSSVEHSKLFNTVRALLFRPGFLTNEWAAGRRKRYLKPLNPCLGVFALSLFVYSVYKPVSMYDIEKFVKQDRREESMQVFDRFAERKRIPRDVLFDRLNDRWQRYMSLATLVFVGAFALVLQLVFLYSRRHFVEHLVFSMHFASFSTLVVILLWPVYFFIGIKQGGWNIVVAILKWTLDIVYIFFAVRAVYRLGTLKTLPAALLLTLGYFIIYVLVLLVSIVAAIVSVALS